MALHLAKPTYHTALKLPLEVDTMDKDIDRAMDEEVVLFDRWWVEKYDEDGGDVEIQDYHNKAVDRFEAFGYVPYEPSFVLVDY
jgi:hypothetical protein